MYAVSEKVEGEEFESEVKTGNGSTLRRHFGEKLQKRPKMGLWLLVSQKFAKIRYRYVCRFRYS